MQRSPHARRGLGEPTAAIVAFVAGYLVTWTIFGLADYAAFALMRTLEINAFSWDAGGPYLAGAVIAAAGVYQLTALKDACLSRCRSPLDFLTERWRAGVGGALRLGLEHGAWCVGCCWALMAALFALGAMRLTWMVFIAALIAIEKLMPGSDWPTGDRRPAGGARARGRVGPGLGANADGIAHASARGAWTHTAHRRWLADRAVRFVALPRDTQAGRFGRKKPTELAQRPSGASGSSGDSRSGPRRSHQSGLVGEHDRVDTDAQHHAPGERREPRPPGGGADRRASVASEPEGVPFSIDAKALGGNVAWNLQTALGDLDLSLEPSGTGGYEDLARSAVTVRLARGLEVRVASLDDVIRCKQAAGRPKDLAALPLLRELQDRL